MSRIYGYLRASTKDQDALRAKQALEAFVKDMGQSVSAWFVEHESGATLKRPELFRLLEIAQRGDVLLVEQVDRISRLNSEDWKHLKSQITGKGIIIVALDLPTSYPEIKKQYFWGGKLWTQSYFVETIGNANEETIRAYVQNQLKVMYQLESASKQINLF